MLSILLTSNLLLLETSLLVHNKNLLLPILTYYFGFTNIRFLSTNIGIIILFLFQSWIPLYQYWHIIFVLLTLHCSTPISIYYFLFTNVGFLHTIISKLLSSYQHWFHLYQYWHIFFFYQCWLPLYQYGHIILFYQCWIPPYQYWYIFFCFANVGIYNTLPALVCHLLIPKINQKYANKKYTISQHWNLKFFPVKSVLLTDNKVQTFLEGEENQYTKRKTKSCVFSGFCVSIYLSWEWKSTTGRFAIGQFWPFTWKTSSVGKDRVNKWEFCKLKIMTVVIFVITIQCIFPS